MSTLEIAEKLRSIATTADVTTAVTENVTSQKGVPNGIPALDSNSRIPEAQLPASLETALVTINGV